MAPMQPGVSALVVLLALACPAAAHAQLIVNNPPLPKEETLVYAVTVGQGVLAYAGIASFHDVFVQVMRGMAAALGSLGIEAAVHAGRSGDSASGARPAAVPQHGLCGRSLTRYEIEIDGGKAVAAAQLVRPGAALQHGTIYLKAPSPEDRFWPKNDNILAGPLAGQRWVDLGAPFQDRPWTQVAELLRQGFAQELSIDPSVDRTLAVATPSVEGRVAQWESGDWHRQR